MKLFILVCGVVAILAGIGYGIAGIIDGHMIDRAYGAAELAFGLTLLLSVRVTDLEKSR